jgi:putative tryptophan/tyrosine transport system substrate-binding protein
MSDMRRRKFMTLLGGAAAGWPLAARAQQPAMPVVGFLYAGSPEPIGHLVAAFRKGLTEIGYVEAQNLAIEFRWARNEIDRLPELAADLVRRQVSVIAVPGSLQGAIAAKAATTSIPIVFSIGGDPVQAGLVASFNRPGGNVTGISSMNTELGSKRLGLLHELIPKAERFALLVTNSPLYEPLIQEVLAGGSAIGRQIDVLYVSTSRDIGAAFASIVQKRVEALVLAPGPLFNNNRVQLATLTARHAVPSIYSSREFAEAGGLMSYGPSITEEFRQTGIYCGRILKGEKPADLPVLRATRFEFIINMQTARALGIEVPPTLLARADEVIE